jgi:hypothetical protein
MHEGDKEIYQDVEKLKSLASAIKRNLDEYCSEDE